MIHFIVLDILLFLSTIDLYGISIETGFFQHKQHFLNKIMYWSLLFTKKYIYRSVICLFKVVLKICHNHNLFSPTYSFFFCPFNHILFEFPLSDNSIHNRKFFLKRIHLVFIVYFHFGATAVNQLLGSKWHFELQEVPGMPKWITYIFILHYEEPVYYIGKLFTNYLFFKKRIQLFIYISFILYLDLIN